MYTIGHLVKAFKLSRSTILYYDKIGLLKPSERTDSNYRLYSESDVEKLKTIMRHKEAGISLDDIRKLIRVDQSNISTILTERLSRIQNEIMMLKKQEGMIISVLMKEVADGDSGLFDKASWIQLLTSIGYNEEDQLNWHINFEEDMPKEHEKFLVALGVSREEIEEFRIKLKQ